jgi:hypothetical protein
LTEIPVHGRLHSRFVSYAIFTICVVVAISIWLSARKRDKPAPAVGAGNNTPTPAETNYMAADLPTIDTPRIETRRAFRSNSSPSVVTAPQSKAVSGADFVQRTLEDPRKPTKPSDIPRLTDEQVDQLASAYLKLARPSEKFGILWALGFSQNDRAFDTLRYALTVEFSGAALSRKDNGTQMWVVPLIGVLARSSDRAWDFLLNLTTEAGWARIEVWTDDALTAQHKSEEASRQQVRSELQSTVFSALGASGRPEFETWVTELMNQTTPEYVRQAALGIEQGVFRAAYIRDRGFTRFYDNVLFHVTSGAEAYIQWTQTTEGKRWNMWWQDQVTQASHQDSATLKK